jgi:amidase
LRIAVTTEPPLTVQVESACAEAAHAAARLLEELGHDVVEATPPWRDDEVLHRFSYVWRMGPALYDADPAELEPLNRALAEAAHTTPALAYAQAVIALQRYARRVAAFWDDVDVVLTPTLAKLPVPIGWVFEPDDPWDQFRRGGEFTPFTPALNVTGQPAASVPFASEDGLPVGVQLIARAGDEATLIRVASQLEEARPWIERRPEVFAA